MRSVHCVTLLLAIFVHFHSILEIHQLTVMKLDTFYSLMRVSCSAPASLARSQASTPSALKTPVYPDIQRRGSAMPCRAEAPRTEQWLRRTLGLVIKGAACQMIAAR